jgi:hypothetical protein
MPEQTKKPHDFGKACQAARAILGPAEGADASDARAMGFAAFFAAEPDKEHFILRGMLEAAREAGQDRLTSALVAAIRDYDGKPRAVYPRHKRTG